MNGQRMYVDVGAARIQHYISRTPRLKGQRGASAWLSWATDPARFEDQARAAGLRLNVPGLEPNPEAGRADGIISVRLPAHTDPEPVAADLARYLRSALPAIELAAIWGTGDSYLEAYRHHMKGQRDEPPLLSLPPPSDFPLLASCAECRAGPAVEQIDIHEETGIGVCLDCLARYQDCYRKPGLAAQARPGRTETRGLPIYREEADLARGLDRHPVDDTARDFTALAALGQADTKRNHVATVYADGNAVGAFFDRIAAHGDPELKARISAAVSNATRDALRHATKAALGQDGARCLPVIPHVVGGDDLVVSVVADRAWQFTVTYLDQFRQRLSAIENVPSDLLSAVPPTASAGMVFAHAKFPFRRAAELAAEQLRTAKRQFCGTTPAVAWLDVTRDGEHPPAGQRAWALDELIDLTGALRALRTDMDASGRAVLERLVDLTRPEVSVARVLEHARRLDRAAVLMPFLSEADPASRTARMAGALSAARWWR
jgi:hypothetical protein